MSRSRCLIAALVVVSMIAASVGAEAGSLSFSWTAPSTNADGSALKDLSGYRIYLATSVPACPSGSFHSVPSATAAPSTGQAVNARVAGLGAGTTYFARITAVDFTGNESTCSPTVSGGAQADFGVTPTATTSFGNLAVGATADRTFTVQNTSTANLTGTTSVAAPFSIVSGGSFSLAPGATQVVTIRFRPTTSGTFATNVNFTAGGDTLSRALSASSTSAATVALTVTKSGTGSGTVTSSPAGISCGADCSESLAVGTPVTLTATAATGSTFVGWGGACSGTAATCALTMSAATAVTATFNTSRVDQPLEPVPVLSSLAPTSIAAGTANLTLTVNGSGFVSTSVVQWNGAARPTTVVSATQLRATIGATDLATARSVSVTVVTPAPGGGTSAARTFTITAPPVTPPPTTAPATPSNTSVRTLATDGDAVTFEVSWGAASGAASYRYVAGFSDGSGAQQGSVTGLLSFQLRMPYHASGAAAGGFVCVRAVGSTGLQSVDQSCTGLTVPARPPAAPTPPVPSISALSPAGATVGSPGLTLTVTGSGFTSGSVVRWNGAARPTTVVGGTQLQAAITAGDLATAGSVPVTVFTPAPGGGTSPSRSFTIAAAPAPSTPPGMPSSPTVTRSTLDSTGVTFDLTWSAGSGATSYRYTAAFSDGSASAQGTVATTSMRLQMPYYRTGAAAGGFVCIQSVNAAGQTSADQACTGLSIPAR